MYKDVKRAVKTRNYASVSEMIRDSLRETLYNKLTINGFTPEVEDEILASAASPDDPDVWETEEDIVRGFAKLRKGIQLKRAKDKKNRKLQSSI